MEPKRISRLLAILPTMGLLFTACGSNRPGADEAAAKAEISGYQPNTQGGTIWFTNAGTEGTKIQGEIVGLLPNRSYAMHIHEFGSCNSPEASGGHFDPINTNRHGTPGASPALKHAGDLPNIQTDGDGKARIDISTQLIGTGTSDFSVIGRSIVIHAEEDDYQTQPAGGSGEKIACGVIQKAEG